MRTIRPASLGFMIWLAMAACGNDASLPTAYFETSAAGHQTEATFWNAPFPAAWRMTAAGGPDLAGYPLGNADAMADLAENAAGLRGVSVVPNVYFRLGAMPTDAALARVGELSPPMATAEAPVVFLNIDPASPDLGMIVPSVASVLVADKYAPDFLLAVAPVPGMVLASNTTYAVAVRQAVGGVVAAAGFAQPPPDIATALAPMWPALEAHGIARQDVVVATVFTTGDVVADLAAQALAVRAAHDAEILALAIDSDGADHEGVCELVGTVRMPQFQRGTPPFATAGEVALDGEGMPVATGTQDVPFVVTLPKATMPDGGWPLHVFVHGSGSQSSLVIDGGRSAVADAPPEAGKGPGYVVAREGMAAVGAAMPLNPERLAGASDYAYLNLANLSAMPHVFAQGVFEQGLLIDAMLALQLSPAIVAACAGVALPDAAAMHTFSAAHVTVGGQSMGGMYANMLGAIDARVRAVVPTGAGGLWHKMALESQEIPGGRDLLAGVVRTRAEALSMLHPAMGLLAMSWHRAEPMAYMARVAFDPLPGMPVRHIFAPAGEGDSFFSTEIYDAAALASRNQLAGTPRWPTMGGALALVGLGDVAPFPVSGNRTNRRGEAYTGVVAQYAADGLLDAHYIWRQRADLKAQYGAFLGQAGGPTPPAVPAPPAAITGGTEVASAAYPSVVAIYLRDTSQLCTGTLIAPDVVLTAGHCLATYATNNIEVRTGISNFAEDAGVTYLVQDWVIHPDFLETGAKIDHDVALIYLTSPVAGIAPTPVNRDATAAAPGGMGTIIGYGRPSLEGTSGILRAAVNLPIAACDRLEEIIFDETGGFVIEYEEARFVCWERLDGIGKCRGDSGGPTLMNVAGTQVVVGVSSASDTTCEFYSLDAEVAHELPFIDGELTARQCGADGLCNSQCQAFGWPADIDCQAAPGCPDQGGPCDPSDVDGTDAGTAGCATARGEGLAILWLAPALVVLVWRRRRRRLA